MTRDLLRKRLAELERQRAEAINKVQAVDGAMQECEFWLAYLEEQSSGTDNAGGSQGQPADLSGA